MMSKKIKRNCAEKRALLVGAMIALCVAHTSASWLVNSLDNLARKIPLSLPVDGKQLQNQNQLPVSLPVERASAQNLQNLNRIESINSAPSSPSSPINVFATTATPAVTASTTEAPSIVSTSVDQQTNARLATTTTTTVTTTTPTPTPTTIQTSNAQTKQTINVNSATSSNEAALNSNNYLLQQEQAALNLNAQNVADNNNNNNNNQQQQRQSALMRDEVQANAVKAVEATMSFGEHLQVQDPCYDEYGNARFCEPEFENVALERQVQVSSECGDPPTKICYVVNERNKQVGNCHLCNSKNPKLRHPAAYLTDVHHASNPTCWASAPLPANDNLSQLDGTNLAAGVDGGTVASSDDVTLTLNFEKRYEITYVSVQFCSSKPDSMAIFKSNDFGASWSPYQFYSTRCRQVYNRPSQQVSRDDLEALCSSINQTSSNSHAGRIAFSPLDGRLTATSNNQQEKLNDWITATNIKIVLDRHVASRFVFNSQQQQHHHSSRRQAMHNSITTSPFTINNNNKKLQYNNNDNINELNSTLLSTTNQQTKLDADNIQLDNSLTNPVDTFSYAISDLTIGGRCKCNGHASRCVHNAIGKLVCDCTHNTEGDECDKCARFHYDRPWQRATQLDANACQPCNCNGHSHKCKFDAELYKLSGRKSGGVCLRCKHNTTGRHCQYCSEGYARDLTKPISDLKACKLCDCHPAGSTGKVCNQQTGQCPCKEGVTGLQCNQCLPGYQQSKSAAEPCVKLADDDLGLSIDQGGNDLSFEDQESQNVVASNLISISASNQAMAKNSIQTNTKSNNRKLHSNSNKQFTFADTKTDNNNNYLDLSSNDEQSSTLNEMKIKLLNKLLESLIKS